MKGICRLLIYNRFYYVYYSVKQMFLLYTPVFQPSEWNRAIYPFSWKLIKNTASSIVSTVSGWFGCEYSSARRPSEGGYSSGGGSYSGNGCGSNYHYISPNEQVTYMSDVEIGLMMNGLGLSGNQLERYQTQRSIVIKKQADLENCSTDSKRYIGDPWWINDYKILNGIKKYQYLILL